MSETAADPRPGQRAAKPAASGGGSVLTRKFAGFPVWAWVAIVGGLLGWRYYSSKKAGASASSSTATATGTPASQVPQFVNQTYSTTVTPPGTTVINPPSSVLPPVVQHPPAPPAPVPTPEAPEPVTISGAPGSFTSNIPPGNMAEWTSNGGYSLNVLAQSHGMTAKQLIASSTNAENNVPLQRYLAAGNYNAKVPSGVQLFFPSLNWTQPLKKVG